MSNNYISRSRILSLSVGLMFVGVAVGPTFGSLLVRATGQALSVFYVAVIFMLLYSFFLWFILPESITEQQMTQARANYSDELLRAAQPEPNFTAALLHKIRRAVTFLSPLSIFLPSSLESPNNAANKHMRDWTLTLLALAYGCTISTMVTVSIT
jgi:MFS family permease